MADRSLQQAIADACLQEGAGEELARDPRGFLERRGVDARDIDAMMPARLAIYRRLVRNTLEGVVYRLLARTRARMNAAQEGAFDAEVDAFLHEVGPRTHYVKDVPGELVAWASPRWRARAELPGYLADLAELELAEVAVASAPDLAEPPGLAELALDRPLVLTAVMRLLALGHAVHRLSAEEDARETPEAGETFLLAYRDEEHAVRFLELSPLAYSVIARVERGEALGDAVKGACEERGRAMDDEVLASVARLLADLGERGVLLGGL